ncbi:hypothetical protein CHS0354_004271 [Potamilus streckersoni]|uniref:Uncharacterized protein n=1 Tax=Potamilus streckersoni TaxID=2493646 RepID=A0AAE0S467_9BIVA|nr:hypothetical protein CHS0354_004271 [Potamilus streckersoni]
MLTCDYEIDASQQEIQRKNTAPTSDTAKIIVLNELNLSAAIEVIFAASHMLRRYSYASSWTVPPRYSQDSTRGRKTLLRASTSAARVITWLASYTVKTTLINHAMESLSTFASRGGGGGGGAKAAEAYASCHCRLQELHAAQNEVARQKIASLLRSAGANMTYGDNATIMLFETSNTFVSSLAKGAKFCC